MLSMTAVYRASFVAMMAAVGSVSVAHAEEKQSPVGFFEGVKFSGHVEVGLTVNTDAPDNRKNFGQLFTDASSQLLLNQALVTLERPIDSTVDRIDAGFKLQGFYGSDARFTHFLNEFDRSIHDRHQLDIVEANLQVHLPYLTAGGIDVKLGQYATPLGFEVIDSTGNPFYSHTYIFNFGLPFKHTGGLITAHVNDTLDLYVGGDTGVNTSIGKGDNNGAPAFIGGFGLNGLLDGKLTVLALAHIGPENPTGTPGVRVNSAVRTISDIYATYKPTDSLALTTEVNYIKDDGFKAQGIGVAQYALYTLNDTVTLGVRAEIFRDDNGFFVSSFAGPLDPVNAERGFPAKVTSGGKTTYGALTLGSTLKPDLGGLLEGAVFRPEVRYDHAFGNSRPFIDSKRSDQLTFAADLTLSF